MKTLFVIQNDTHAKNFDILAREAIANGEDVSILLLDRATHESTEQFIDESLVSSISHVERTAHSFYRSNGLQRLSTCMRFHTWARTSIGVFDHVVLGNDGALQKIVVKAARAENANCRVTVMLDGLLTREKSFAAALKRRMQRLAEMLNVDEFVPSTVGISRLIDDIVVMHASVADVLRFHGVAAHRVEVSALPRHAAIRATTRPETHAGAHILFLGSAYLWHNEQIGHRRQTADFAEFGDFATRWKDGECRLRIHPRDHLSAYAQLDRTRLQISDGATSLEQDLKWADIVVASRSSGLFDATLAGRRAVVYAANFPAPEEDVFLSSLPCVSTFEELLR